MFAAELGVSAVALGGITLGLSIAIPLITAIGAYFTRTGENAKGGSSGINAYADALKGLTEEIQKNEQAFLKAKFGTSDQNVANAKQQIKELQDQIQALSFGGGYGAGAASAIQGRNEKAANADKIAALQEQLGLLIHQENVKVGVAAAEEASRLIAMQKLDALTKQREEYLKQFGYVKDLANAEKEAANMLEGKNSVAKNLQDQAMQAKLEEFRLAKEREKTEEVAAEKAEYLRQVFHMLAGETSSISTGIKPLPAILDKAAIAAYKLAAAMADTKTAANAVLSSMIQVEAARSRKQGQVQAAAAGFVGRPELDTVGNRAAVNAAKSAILEERNAPNTGGGGDKKDPLAELQKQIVLQEDLIGKTEAEKRVRQALGDSWATYSPTVIKGLEEQIQKQMELEDRLKEQQQIFDTVKTSMEDAFMGMVDGTKTAKDAFKQMAAAIIKELYNVLVVQQLVGSFDRATGQGAGITGFLGKALTGMFKADGGPVSAGQPYIVGERGPEMIIPKSSGMVLTNGQTKAALGGISNDNYVVHNNISVTGSDSAMVRQEIAKMIPQISSATKAAMIDAKRRGGQMGNAFR
jgi:hypothetical protein